MTNHCIGQLRANSVEPNRPALGAAGILAAAIPGQMMANTVMTTPTKRTHFTTNYSTRTACRGTGAGNGWSIGAEYFRLGEDNWLINNENFDTALV
jgi:hypothetical protein